MFIFSNDQYWAPAVVKGPERGEGYLNKVFTHTLYIYSSVTVNHIKRPIISIIINERIKKKKRCFPVASLKK